MSNCLTVPLVFISPAPSANTSDIYDAVSANENFRSSVLYLGGDTNKWRHDVKPKNIPFDFVVKENCGGLTKFKRYFSSIIRRIFFGSDTVWVVQGYAGFYELLTIFLLVLMERKWVFWGERVQPNHSLPIYIRIAKKIAISQVKKADSIWGIGLLAVESYVNHGVRREKIHNLPYGSKLEPFVNFPIDQNETNGREGEIVVITTSRLIPRKRVERVIAAFDSLNKIYPDSILHIIGDGPERERLEKTVPESLLDRIFWHGNVHWDKQAELYRKSDLFVFAPFEEGWGAVVVEAASAGLPLVIQGVVPAMQDLVAENSMIGRYIDDEDDLFDNMQYVLERYFSGEITRMGCRNTAKAMLATNIANRMTAILVSKVVKS